MKRLIIRKADEIEIELLKKRLDIAMLIIISLVAVLVARLWYLQIHKGTDYAELAESNRIRQQNVAAPRGSILDRQGRPVVTNKPCFNVVWNKEDAPRPEEVIKQLSYILNEDISVLLDRIRAAADAPNYLPVRLKENIDWETLVYVENHLFELPGTRIEVVPRRQYLYTDLASHLIGYLGEINEPELKERLDKGYEPGDQIGKMGLEKLEESHLRGQKGARHIEVDVHGNLQRLLEEELAMPGNDIVLTLDIDLQRAAEEAMAGRAGGVAVLEVKTGRVLALASMPTLHLEDFLGGIAGDKWKMLLKSPLHPLVNKTIQGQYPPGSTYKIITAVAGLAEGVVTPQTSFLPSLFR